MTTLHHLAADYTGLLDGEEMMKTIFRNARVYRPFKGTDAGMTVILEGNQITVVMRDAEAPATESGVRAIDLGGKTILPGLTTGHWHPDYPNLKLSELDSVHISMEKPPAFLAAVAVKALGNALDSGFTNVIGAGCGFDIDASMKMAIAEGWVAGPRIRAGGHHINTTGADNDRAKWWYNMRPPYQAGVSIVGAELMADGVAALRRAVRDEISRGVEVIKIFPTGGHGIAPIPGYRAFTPDELKAICEAAHDRNGIVRAHVVGREAILECIEAGVDIIDHGDGADEDCIAAMEKAGTFFVPSMLFLKSLLALPQGALPDAIMSSVRSDYDGMLAFMPKIAKSGVRIVPGDDYGLDFIPHVPGIYARDLMIHVEEAGIAAKDVLGWITHYGAQMMNRDDLGEIAPGKTADLIVLEGDPCEDFALLTDPVANLKAVMIDGKFHKDRLQS